MVPAGITRVLTARNGAGRGDVAVRRLCWHASCLQGWFILAGSTAVCDWLVLWLPQYPAITFHCVTPGSMLPGLFWPQLAAFLDCCWPSLIVA